MVITPSPFESGHSLPSTEMRATAVPVRLPTNASPTEFTLVREGSLAGPRGPVM